MQEGKLQVLGVIGTLHQNSVTGVTIRAAAEALGRRECIVDIFDPSLEPLDLFNPDTSYNSEQYKKLKPRVEAADVLLLGTPDYHGSMSSTLKNFLDHFWQEFAGKLFASVVSSYEKGLTVTDQIRTVARQCYAWSLPYGIAFLDKEDVRDGLIATESLKGKIQILVNDIAIYGRLLAEQRQRDLQGGTAGFMAKYRKPV